MPFSTIGAEIAICNTDAIIADFDGEISRMKR